MIRPLEKFVDTDFVYRFSHGPQVVATEQAARAAGINCVSLAHLALRDLYGQRLPSDLLCTEMWFDREYFRPLEDGEQPQLGDLNWFGVRKPKVVPTDFVPSYEGSELVNWRDFPINHVAIHLGETDDQGDPLLLHASQETGTTSVWPSRQFGEYRRYARSYGASRLLVADVVPAQLVTAV